jgi:hypothetical protein
VVNDDLGGLLLDEGEDRLLVGGERFPGHRRQGEPAQVGCELGHLVGDALEARIDLVGTLGGQDDDDRHLDFAVLGAGWLSHEGEQGRHQAEGLLGC